MSNPRSKGHFDESRAVWRRAEGISPTDPGQSGWVEVAFVDDLIGLRDSRRPEGPILVFTEQEWEAFLGGAKDGEFDV
jgi:hypothetical protein